MTRILKYTLWVLLGVFCLLMVAVISLNLVPGDYYKPLLSSGVRSVTGRDLTIRDLDLSLTTVLRFKASGVGLSNTEWGSRPQMAELARIEGKVPLLPLLQGILDVTLAVDDLDLLLETNRSGQGNWDLISPSGIVRPYLRKVRFKGTRIEFVGGRGEEPFEIFSGRLNVESVDGKLKVELGCKFDGLPVKFAGGFDDARFLTEKRSSRLKFRGNLGGADFVVAGSAGPLTPMINLDIAVSLDAGSIAVFNRLADRDLPQIGPLAASFKLAANKGRYAVSDLSAALDDDRLTVNITGAIADLENVSGIAIDASVETSRLAEVLRTAGFEPAYPIPETFSTNFSIAGALENLAVEHFQAQIAGRGVSVSGSGRVNNAMTLDGVFIDLDVKTETPAFIEEISGMKLPPAGPIAATAKIVSKIEKRNGTHGLEITDLQARLADGRIRARGNAAVDDVISLTGMSAAWEVTIDSPATLGAWLDRELPSSPPLLLKGELIGAGGLEAPIHINASMETEGVHAGIKGDIAEPRAAQGIDLALALEADSLQRLSTLAGAPVAYSEPFKAESQFTFDRDIYDLRAIRVQVGELDVTGDLSLQQPSEPGGRPRVTGRLHTGRLGLPDAISPAAPRSTSSESAGYATDTVFLSDPLPFHFLQIADANLEFTAQSIETRHLYFKNPVMRLALDNGLLQVHPFARVGRGEVNGRITLDGRQTPPALVAFIEMTNGTFRNFGGNLHFLADVEGRGRSVAEVMAQMNGRLKAEVRDAVLEQSFMTQFGKGLFNSLLPFRGGDTTELLCAIAVFDITDGIADASRKIAAQMPMVTWFGGGEVDFRTEKIEFAVSPVPRKDLVHLGSLADLVYIGGTMARPGIVLNPKGAAVKLGKYGAAVATGGLTWLVDRLRKLKMANVDVCARILERLERDEASKRNTR